VPTYDYQCRSCGVITEVVHSMLVDGPSECERCGGPLRRVVHPTGIIFKGSGFYKTDSRSSTSGSVGGGTRGTAPASHEGAPPTTTSTDHASTDHASTDHASTEKGKPSSGDGATKGAAGGD
jgi:putative FmdB family regulatory protein